MRKSAAWPLTWIYLALVVYASLYPFTGWRDQGIPPWSFLWAAPPRYWTGFDVAINVVGYMPLGALLALLVLRSPYRALSILLAMVCGAALSVILEGVQSYLPQRVASREDWLLNSVGTLLGACGALLLQRSGGLARWDRWQQRWLAPQSRSVLVLLATWPAALLFPCAVPFGVGQVLERIRERVAQVFVDLPAPVPAWDAWWSGPVYPLVPLSAATEWFCVVLGLLIPCLLGYCVVRTTRQRVVMAVVLVAVGVVASGLSAALSWGPAHTWAWLDAPTRWGLVLATAMAAVLAAVPWRWSAGLALLALAVQVVVLNQAPESPYFAQTLQTWEQGRFIRFNGLAQWVGWLWPYAAIGVAALQVARPETEPKIAP
ncbi:MAG: VanZ family protein [Betaproteobacteria bacterium]